MCLPQRVTAGQYQLTSIAFGDDNDLCVAFVDIAAAAADLIDPVVIVESSTCPDHGSGGEAVDVASAVLRVAGWTEVAPPSDRSRTSSSTVAGRR